MANILVVEEDIGSAELLREYLSFRGHSVEIAMNGAEALERLMDGQERVVLLEVCLPDINGWELLRQIKGRSDIGPATSVVLISTSCTEETAGKAKEAGAYEFLEKPWSLRKVADLVALAAAEKEAQKEDFQAEKRA